VIPHLQGAAGLGHVQIEVAGELRFQAVGLEAVGGVLGENVVMGEEAHAGLHHPGQADVHLAPVQVFQVGASGPGLVEHAAQGVDRRGVGRAARTQFVDVGGGALEIVLDQQRLVFRFVKRHADTADAGSVDVALETGSENLVAQLDRLGVRQEVLDAQGEHLFLGQFFYARLIETLDVKHHLQIPLSDSRRTRARGFPLCQAMRRVMCKATPPMNQSTW